MAEKKITRKELLKEPDEFLTFSGQAIRYIRENPRHSLAVAILIVVCLVAGVAYQNYRNYRENKSHELFLQASRDYEDAINAAAPIAPEKLDKLLTQFDDIVKNYGSLPAGEMALLYSGHVLGLRKDYRGALQRYQRVESTLLAREGLRELFWYHIARTRMALKEYDQAADLFEKLSKDTDSPYRREAYVAIARIYELTDKTKEAVQAYRQYLKVFPEAPDAAYVKARIAELSVQSG